MFTTPLFLIAAAVGAVVPLFLHLLQTRKRVKTPFPTLRFLQLAQKQSSRRIKMENMLLWLIRTLIMAFLGLAFAMPVLRNRGFAWLGDSPRDIAIVIDASYSMGYNTGRETVWNKSLDAARQIIEGLGEKDRYCLYLAHEQPEAIIAEPVGDKEMGLSRLKSLEPGSAGSQLAPAVSAAMKALRRGERGSELELHVITDNQALAWESFGSGGSSQWDPKIIEDDDGVFVTLLGVSAPENTGPAAIELLPPIVRPDSAAEVTATLTRTGVTRPSAATLFINGEESSRRSIDGNSTDGSAPLFVLPPLPVGVHNGRIETPQDNLPIDDAFHFLIRVEQQLPSLCIGSQTDSVYLRTALKSTAGKGGEAPRLVAPNQVDSEDLASNACIFLCNALPLSGPAINAIEEYVRQGGLLVVFPGMSAGIDAYANWSCLPGTPVEIAEVPLSLRRRTLTWDKPRHPMLRPLREANSVPPITVRRSLVWEKLHEETESLVSMGAGLPFLLDRPFGSGRVLLFAVAADRTWSDLPLSPFYLPLVAQCIDYSAGLGAKTPYAWATDSMPLSGLIPDNPAGLSLRGPDRKAVPIRSNVEQGRTVMIAEDLHTPGVYTMTGASLPEETNAIAINLPRTESDLTPIETADLRQRLGIAEIYLSGDTESLMRTVEEHRIGRTYGEHLLWAALILVIIEFSLANLMLRKGGKLSADLDVSASGMVKGHA